MPLAKKRKKQGNLVPITKRKTTDETTLQTLLLSKSWEETVKYLKTNHGKEDAKCTEIAVGSTSYQCFLHLALEQKIPMNVICSLIKAHPDAARLPNKDGYLPLHFVAGGRYSLSQVVSPLLGALLDAYPEAVKQRGITGLLPLHEACELTWRVSSTIFERILSLHPEGANQTATFGFYNNIPPNHLIEEWLPIHVACCKKSSIDVINMLIKANPQSLQKQTSEAEIKPPDISPPGLPVLEYPSRPLKNFENLTPFQLSFKHHLLDAGTKYKNIPEEGKFVIVSLLKLTHPNVSSVKQERFYAQPRPQLQVQNQTERRRRNPSRKVKNKNSCYTDKNFLLLHYALLCKAPLDVIKTISEDVSLLKEKNMDGEFPLHCALDTNNVSAAMHLNSWDSPFRCTEMDRDGRWPLHAVLSSCSPYDDRRNHLLHCMFKLDHKSAGKHLQYFKSGQQLLYPLQIYLLQMMMTPDADPRHGCGSVAAICPFVVRDLMRGCPSAVQTLLHCQTMRSGYNFFVATIPDGIPLHPFQIASLMFNDMFISNLNSYFSKYHNPLAFWQERDLGYTHSILMREQFNDHGKIAPKVEKDTMDRDVLIIEILFEMLRLNPAAIATE